MADTYDKFPHKLAQERGITLTPLPPLNVDRSNPANFTCCLLVEHDARDPSPQKGNLLIPDTEDGMYGRKSAQNAFLTHPYDYNG